MGELTAEQLEELRTIDSPTIANAIEKFEVRDPTEGHASMNLRCLFPDLPPAVGYAVTCTMDSMRPGKGDPRNYPKLLRAIDAAPKPGIVVMKDIGSNPERSCHAGDVMASIFQRLGVAAVVTDGGVRDLAGVRRRAPGFQMFAPGEVVSHGAPSLVEVGMTVSICGLRVRPGDLLHGDANGLVTIPHAIAGSLAASSREVWQKESEIIDSLKDPDFTLESHIKKYWS